MNMRFFNKIPLHTLFAAFWLFCQVCPAIGQDVTSDTTAIRAILQANGVSDTVPITYNTLPPPAFATDDGRVSVLAMNGLDLTDLTSNIGILNLLEVLTLSDNNLTAIPQEIGNLQALSKLDLNNNNLIAIPQEIGNLQALSRLDLNNNNLTALPPEIGNIPFTVTNGVEGSQLYLNNNQLTALPNEIRGWTALEGLFLNNNKLTSLPDSIGSLAMLSTLEVNNNNIAELPASIGNLPILRSIFINNNSLTSFPEEIVNTPISLLQAENNQITSLPDSIGKMSGDLSNLNLANNNIAELPNSFIDLNLTYLDLENNDLERFPPGITTSMSFGPVGSLNIHGNRLCSLITQPVADWLDLQAGTGGWRQSQRCNVGAVQNAQGPGSPFTVSQNASTLQIVFKEKTGKFKAGVYDQAGRIVAHLQGEGGVAQWDVSGTQRGVYIVRVREGGDSWVRKVVIQ